jgi:hypothetical protein
VGSSGLNHSEAALQHNVRRILSAHRSMINKKKFSSSICITWQSGNSYILIIPEKEEIFSKFSWDKYLNITGAYVTKLFLIKTPISIQTFTPVFNRMARIYQIFCGALHTYKMKRDVD